MDTGGPAFPWVSDKAGTVAQGMTLRDYFAAKAMQADMSTYTEDLIYENLDWFMGRAEKWYEIADAMLKAREQ